jgi:hypothetical protein
MQPLLLVKQTMDVGYDPGPLLLSGPNVAFSSAVEMFWKGGYGSEASQFFSIGFRDYDGEYNELSFCQTSHGVDLQEMKFRQNSGTPLVSIQPGADLREIFGLVASDDLGRILKDVDYTVALARDRCFFRLNLTAGDTNFGPAGPYPALRNKATNMLHVPGLRDNPARFYPATQVGDIFPGVFQSYVASIIHSWTETKDDRLGELGQQLQKMGLTWKVATQRIDDTRVALRVGRLPRSKRGGSRDLVNIADVGLGVSQVLPVLVALLTAGQGDWVFIEQPEIHLHPRAQVALAYLLAQTAARGVRVICETHSYLLLRAIQEVAVSTNAPKGAVGLNWFSRDDTGETHVDSVYLAENGTFGDWPNDFADVEMDIEDRYLQAVLKSERSRK